MNAKLVKALIFIGIACAVISICILLNLYFTTNKLEYIYKMCLPLLSGTLLLMTYYKAIKK
jgi:hypothetical protein